MEANNTRTAEEILIECTDSFQANTRLKSDVIEAMEKYASQFKSAAAPQEQETFVWVKASEVMPDNDESVFIRWHVMGNGCAVTFKPKSFIAEIYARYDNQVEWLSTIPPEGKE